MRVLDELSIIGIRDSARYEARDGARYEAVSVPQDHKRNWQRFAERVRIARDVHYMDGRQESDVYRALLRAYSGMDELK